MMLKMDKALAALFGAGIVGNGAYANCNAALVNAQWGLDSVVWRVHRGATTL
jgi:hypothetical protein